MTIAEKPRILFTGASGQLGRFLIPGLAKHYTVCALGHRREPDCNVADSHCVDLLQSNLDELIDRMQSCTVINCAALATDRLCGENPDIAKKLNTELPARLAKSCLSKNVQLIHMSTDQVYEGTGTYYRESDPAIPVNLYGKTKLDAEIEVEKANDQAIILRLALVYGAGVYSPQQESGPFSHFLIQQLRQGNKVRLFTDEYRSILYNQDLLTLLQRICRSADQLPGGIYNVAGGDRMNRYDFAIRLARTFSFERQLMEPILASSLDFSEPRPADCSMNTGKLFSLSNWRPTELDSAITAMRQVYQQDIRGHELAAL